MTFILAPTSSYPSKIQLSNSQHTEFVLLVMNVITNNDNLTAISSSKYFLRSNIILECVS